jgi:hypothetical protein
LTRNSLTFTPYLSSGIHYYEPIIIFVSINGLYRFQSISSVDSYGFLYFDYFNPSNLTENFLDIDDDSAGTGQFLIRYTLQSNSRYILVTTTFDPNVTTSFSILASGPERVYFNSINNTSTTTEITSTTTQTTSTTTQITSTTTTQITSTATQITPTSKFLLTSIVIICEYWRFLNHTVRDSVNFLRRKSGSMLCNSRETYNNH